MWGAHLSDGHGAEDVEEDEGAVCEVITHEVAVRQTLDQGEGGEGKLCHDMAVKPEQINKIKKRRDEMTGTRNRVTKRSLLQPAHSRSATNTQPLHKNQLHNNNEYCLNSESGQTKFFFPLILSPLAQRFIFLASVHPFNLL